MLLIKNYKFTCTDPLVKCITTAHVVRNHVCKCGILDSVSDSTTAAPPAFIKCSVMYRLKYDSNFIFLSSTRGNSVAVIYVSTPSLFT